MYLTLALAVFDFEKIIPEEEVFIPRDIYRHSSTQRTITRFISAVLIALLLEELLFLFKTLIGYSDNFASGVWVMFSVVG